MSLTIRKTLAGRNALSNLFKGIGAEIGVEKGKFSSVIMETATKMYAVDIWSSYEDYRTHVSDEEYSAIEQSARDRLKGKNVEFLKMFSADSAKLIPDNSLDWVYIDADHRFDSVTNDLLAWYPKVRSGGIVSGHDFINHKGFGVVLAVTSFCQQMGVNELTVWKGDRSPSWHFVKP